MKWTLTTRSTVLLVIVLSLALYVLSYIFAYCNDAYVMSDLIRVTPQVAGMITKMNIRDNQFVKKNTLLLVIDPEPFQLAVQQKRAALAQARLEEQLLIATEQRTQAALYAEEAKLKLADLTLKRYQSIRHVNAKAIAKQDYQEILEKQQVASANITMAKAALIEAEQAVAAQTAKIKMIDSELHTAEYYLTLTRIYAPTDGHINNLRVYEGDYAKPGMPLFGIVSSTAWRVIANYKDYIVSRIHPGQKVLIFIFGYGPRIFVGEIENVGTAVARVAMPENPALPYVPPITDWIRYPYRFPVRIRINHLPANARLYMGADARTLILP